MNPITRNIPNSITCLNLAAGLMSIVCAFGGAEQLWGLKAYEWAFIFIGIAAVADFLDGFAARALHAYSELGKELDSLCDLVSFGVAPAMIMLNCLESVAPETGWIKWGALLIPVAGALRLAKFNIDTRQTSSFIGLPIPANAIFWIGYASMAYSGVETLVSPLWWIPVLLLESWLMISPLRLFSLKFKTWGWKGTQWRWLLIVTAIVLVSVMGVPGLMWLIVAYLLYGIAAGGK